MCGCLEDKDNVNKPRKKVKQVKKQGYIKGRPVNYIKPKR